MTRYSDDAINFIIRYRDAIINAASQIGVSANAVAGAIAEERHAYWALDANPVATYPVTHDSLLASYSQLKDYDKEKLKEKADKNWLKDKWDTVTDKLTHLLLNDVGPANIKKVK